MSHNGPLHGVPVAAAAKYRDDPAFAEILHGGKHVFQSVGGVGIVNEDAVGLSGGGDYLHPALDAGGRFQCGGAVRQGNAQLLCDTHNRQRVVDGELSGDGQRHRRPFLAGYGRKANALRQKLQIFAPQIGGTVYAGGQHRAGGRRENPVRIAVVRIDDRQTAAAEQLGLGFAVSVHGLVEVQMVFRQVGKGGDVKMNAADALQGNGVAGNLHHHMGAARVPHFCEQRLQFKALRGGSLGGNGLLTDHIGHGADQPHLRPQTGFQNLL